MNTSLIGSRLQTLLQPLQLRERRLRLFRVPARPLAYERDGLGPPIRLQHLKNLAADFDAHAAPAPVRVERAPHRRERPPAREHRPRVAPPRLYQRGEREQ